MPDPNKYLDLTGLNYLVGKLKALITTHTTNTENPHGVTAAQVGAAEKFLVTVTRSGSTFTSDKTYEEIQAAYEAGKLVIGKCSNMVMLLTDVNPYVAAFAAGMDYGNMCMTISPDGTVWADDVTFLTNSSMDNHNQSSSAHESLFNGKLDTFGGELSGPLYLHADPTANDQAATKKYVDDADAKKLPIDGSEAITGEKLWINNGKAQFKAGGSFAQMEVLNTAKNEDNARGLFVYGSANGLYGNIADSIRLVDTVSGSETHYKLYGEHNKPTPSDLGAATAAIYTATITESGWVENGTEGYKKTINVTGILSTDTPVVDLVLTGTKTTDTAAIAEYAKVQRITTGDGTITLYAYDETPASTFTIQLKVVR